MRQARGLLSRAEQASRVRARQRHRVSLVELRDHRRPTRRPARQLLLADLDDAGVVAGPRATPRRAPRAERAMASSAPSPGRTTTDRCRCSRSPSARAAEPNIDAWAGETFHAVQWLAEALGAARCGGRRAAHDRRGDVVAVERVQHRRRRCDACRRALLGQAVERQPYAAIRPVSAPVARSAGRSAAWPCPRERSRTSPPSRPPVTTA